MEYGLFTKMYFQLRMGDFPLPLLAFRSVHVKQWVNAPHIITSRHDKTDMMSLGLISGLVMISLNSSWSSVSEGEQRTAIQPRDSWAPTSWTQTSSPTNTSYWILLHHEAAENHCNVWFSIISNENRNSKFQQQQSELSQSFQYSVTGFISCRE